MENIQRELAKEIAALQPLKSLRKNRRWTLLFVGDHGQVVAVRWFRWMALLGVSLLVLAAVVSGVLYYHYRHTRHVNEGLQQSLDHMQRQIVELRRDKEILMAQVVVSRTKPEKLQAQPDPKPVEKAPADKPVEHAKKELRPDSKVVPPSGSVLSGTDGKSVSASPAVDLAVVQRPDPKLSIEEFNVSHEAEGGMFRAEFVLKNSGPYSHPVSGYSAVILKNSAIPPDQWMSLPTLQLAEGMPAGDKVGQYFSIARFKTVRFSIKSKMDPRQYDTATVYVFDENKKLFFEKNFSIAIQETAAAPSP